MAKHAPAQGRLDERSLKRILEAAGVETEEQLDALCLMAGHDEHLINTVVKVCGRCRQSWKRRYTLDPKKGLEFGEWTLYQRRSA